MWWQDKDVRAVGVSAPERAAGTAAEGDARADGLGDDERAG